MDIGFALFLHRELRNARCIFGYSGPFPDEHSARLIELGEAVREGPEEAPVSKGRLGYIMVEAYQNIVRHRSESGGMKPWGDGRSLFMLRCGAHGQRVIAQNPVARQQVEKLDGLLAELHGKDNAALKRRYLEEIQRASRPGARGAGLGLIEMVRRSGGNATWEFTPIDAAHVRFALALDLGGMPAAPGPEGDAGLRREVLKHQVPLFYGGRWSCAVEDVLRGFAAGESPARGRELQVRTRKFGRMVRLVRSFAGDAAPLLVVLHGAGGPGLAVGAVMDEGRAREMSDGAPGGDGGAGLCSRPVDGGVLAMLHTAW